MYSLGCKSLVSSLLLLTLATSLASSQFQNSHLKLNATISLWTDDKLSLVLICHYHTIEQTIEEIRTLRRHRDLEANTLSFQLNGTTILPHNNYGLTDYQEWDFESGAMAECVLPKSELFIGIFSCKSSIEISSVVEVISSPDNSSLIMIYAIAAVCSVLVVCTCIALLFVVCLFCYVRSRNIRRANKFTATFNRPQSRNVSFTNNRSNLASTDLEIRQQKCISQISHSDESLEDTNSPEKNTLDSSSDRYESEQGNRNKEPSEPFINRSVSATSISQPSLPGQQPQRKFSKPFHTFLMNNVAAKIPAKWRAVGTQLNLSIARLDQIEHDYKNADRCYSEVFSLWEKQVDNAATYEWASLFEALRSPHVSEKKLANSIELIIKSIDK